ncbi:MAG: type III secretion system stator protein SctL [Oligoflexales bacterium]|nr:type III secretion system stator protein SctL [Oligoflexales bacterium]
MEPFVKDISSPYPVNPAIRVLKSKDYRDCLSAMDILRQAKVRADEIISEAKAAYENQERLGFKEGLDRARREQAKEVFKASLHRKKFFKSLESEFTGMVISAAGKIIGDLPPEDQIAKMIQSVLDQYSMSKNISIKVSPENVDLLKQDIGGLLKDDTEHKIIKIEEDPSLADDECILEDDLGAVVETGIRNQLAALRDALSESYCLQEN